NTPYTTYSTLSLHDALPICATAQVRKSPPKPAIFKREPPTPVTEIRSKSQSQGHSHTSRISIFSFGRKRRQLEQKSYGANVFKTDRKSTRLNSSHQIISYAV